MRLFLIRHGESTGNASGIIQGRGSSPLSERGRAQADAVAERLASVPFDAVLSSDMERAVETAEALGRPFEQDPGWREIDLGAWDGVPIDELADRFPEELRALRSGEDVPIGGTGESIPQFTKRVDEAIRRLADRFGPDARVAVFAHGGVIERAVAVAIGKPNRVAFAGRVDNTAITELEVGERLRVIRYNDARHLGRLQGWAGGEAARGSTVLTLVRHGETVANQTGTWQGQTDGGLSEEGVAQALALANAYGRFDVLYSSSLGRALETASALTADGPPIVDESIVELGMGAWEGHTVEEITAKWPDLWSAIYDEGRDEQRGGDGETWSGMVERVTEAFAAIAARHPGVEVGVVSHGAAIRGYAAGLLGLDHEHRRRLAAPANTALTHVVFTERGPVLADYNVSPNPGL